MKLTVGKKIGSSFVILILVSAITGGLTLYWLQGLTATNHEVLTVGTPSAVEGKTLLSNFEMGVGAIMSFIASGDEKHAQNFEKEKTEIQESYKRLEELSNHWDSEKDKGFLKGIGNSLDKFYASAKHVIETRRSPENDVA